MSVISASRRTDIPAFYMAWMMNRLRAGSASYPNPRTGQYHEVPLRPEDVHSIVFWSKDFSPFLSHVAELKGRGYRFYCHYTITGQPRDLESRVPDWRQSVEVFHELAALTGPRQVQWRFDPILLTNRLDASFYTRRFREIATALTGSTRRCYFSFASFYAKVRRQLQGLGVPARDPALEERRALVESMAAIARECGITLFSCCSDALVSDKVLKAHCIDGDLLAELFPDRPRVSRHRPTRPECGCVVSQDIGVYDTCPHGCIYCYANQNQTTALARYQAHRREDAVLTQQAGGTAPSTSGIS